tara:strand:+ start:140 stop:592 length:453 start_codon:yes stop_codon:yes gene_type:complete
MILDTLFRKIAKEFLLAISKNVDNFTSKKGEIVETADNELTLLTPSHIQFAKYGRGPGKKPPLDNILEWVKSENVAFAGLSERGTAFAIQNSIAKNGTKNWVPNAPNAMDEAISANSKQYNKELNDTLVVEIRDTYNKQLRKIFPPKMEI